MTIDVFRECRERVSAEAAARHYGLEINRHGKAHCPFHMEKTPSMSFRGGRFKCFGCGASGDAVDFTGRLLGLSPSAAVERLNADFNLGLPLHRKPTPAEAQAARRRLEITEAHRAFEEWRNSFIDRLNAAYRRGHLALKGISDLGQLTGKETAAVRGMATLEYLSDSLTYGDMDEQMKIFRQRKEVEALCNKILHHTPMKSGAA